MVFFVAGGAAPPCSGAGCIAAVSNVIPNSIGVAGGAFGGFASNPAFMTPTGVFTASIAANGAILGLGAAVTTGGTAMAGIPFTGQAASSFGFPATTGRLTISQSENLGPPEVFIRVGTDARDADGNGVVALVSGSVSERSISGPNSNRTWVTLEIPEPSAIMAASAGLFALFGCHRLVRRRSS
jgi:hypothetical protein